MKQQLKSKYELSDMGEAKHVLGMRIQRTVEGHIHLDQSVYLRAKLEEFQMAQCKSVSTPGVRVTPSTTNNDAKVNSSEHITIVG